MNLTVITEFIIILIFAYLLYSKFAKLTQKKYRAEESVPINNKFFITTPNGILKYYFEPKANSRIYDVQPVWLKNRVIYTINSDTLNERFDYSIQKPVKTFRIITLGDSFTFGEFVSTTDNWTEVLEDKLNTLDFPKIKRFEVINLGVRAYGPEYIKERYIIRGQKYNPDLIIWNESGYDFDRVNELFAEATYKYEQEMSDEKKREKLDQGEYLVFKKAVNDMYRNYSFDELTKMVGKSWQEFFDIRGNVPVLVTSFEYLSKDKKQLLLDWGKDRKNVLYHLNLPNFYQIGLSYPDGHPNVGGHLAIATSTFNYIRQSILKV